MSKEMRKSVKPDGTKPCTMYGLCKLHKQQVHDCHPTSHFDPFYWFYRLQALTTNLAKFLVPLLNHLTKSKYTDFCKTYCNLVKRFASKTLHYLWVVDIDSLFTNIPLDET